MSWRSSALLRVQIRLRFVQLILRCQCVMIFFFWCLGYLLSSCILSLNIKMTSLARFKIHLKWTTHHQLLHVHTFSWHWTRCNNWRNDLFIGMSFRWKYSVCCLKVTIPIFSDCVQSKLIKEYNKHFWKYPQEMEFSKVTCFFITFPSG